MEKLAEGLLLGDVKILQKVLNSHQRKTVIICKYLRNIRRYVVENGLLPELCVTCWTLSRIVGLDNHNYIILDPYPDDIIEIQQYIDNHNFNQIIEKT
jgi:hypothetical protein